MKINGAQRTLILGSQSPRRKELLDKLGFSFNCLSADVDEENHPDLPPEELAVFLAEKKAQALLPQIPPKALLLTADTIVWHQGQSLAKAHSAEEALSMLRQLSGQTHQVISAFCLTDGTKTVCKHDTVQVHFNTLNERWLKHYVERHQPFDKAGAYGIQEWIGMVGIPKIEGSYFTVMGLPTHLVFEALQNW